MKKSKVQNTKNTRITYDKDGTMKIGGRKCERLTKSVLLQVAKKLGAAAVYRKFINAMKAKTKEKKKSGTSRK